MWQLSNVLCLWWKFVLNDVRCLLCRQLLVAALVAGLSIHIVVCVQTILIDIYCCAGFERSWWTQVFWVLAKVHSRIIFPLELQILKVDCYVVVLALWFPGSKWMIPRRSAYCESFWNFLAWGYILHLCLLCALVFLALPKAHSWSIFLVIVVDIECQLLNERCHSGGKCGCPRRSTYYWAFGKFVCIYPAVWCIVHCLVWTFGLFLYWTCSSVDHLLFLVHERAKGCQTLLGKMSWCAMGRSTIWSSTSWICRAALGLKT